MAVVPRLRLLCSYRWSGAGCVVSLLGASKPKACVVRVGSPSMGADRITLGRKSTVAWFEECMFIRAAATAANPGIPPADHGALSSTVVVVSLAGRIPQENE